MKNEEVIHHLSAEAERCERLAAAAVQRAKKYAALAESCAAAAEALGGRSNGHALSTRTPFAKKTA